MLLLVNITTSDKVAMTHSALEIICQKAFVILACLSQRVQTCTALLGAAHADAHILMVRLLILLTCVRETHDDGVRMAQEQGLSSPPCTRFMFILKNLSISKREIFHFLTGNQEVGCYDSRRITLYSHSNRFHIDFAFKNQFHFHFQYTSTFLFRQAVVDPYQRPSALHGVPKALTLYQYEVCPYCCKVKAALDYYKVSPPTRLSVLVERSVRTSSPATPAIYCCGLRAGEAVYSTADPYKLSLGA